jgi:hypothetical protein
VNSAIILGSLLVGSSNLGYLEHFGASGPNIPAFDTGTDENLAESYAKAVSEAYTFSTSAFEKLIVSSVVLMFIYRRYRYISLSTRNMTKRLTFT